MRAKRPNQDAVKPQKTWQRKHMHHFQKHNLPSHLKLDEVLQVFGAKDVPHALTQIKQAKPSTLRDLFNRIFNTATRSQNKVWLQRRLAEALQVQPSDCFPLQQVKNIASKRPQSTEETSDLHSTEVYEANSTDLAQETHQITATATAANAAKQVESRLVSLDSFPIMVRAPNALVDVNLEDCTIDTAPSTDKSTEADIARIAELAANLIHHRPSAYNAAITSTHDTNNTMALPSQPFLRGIVVTEQTRALPVVPSEMREKLQKDPSWAGVNDANGNSCEEEQDAEMLNDGSPSLEEEEKAAMAQLNDALVKLYGCRQRRLNQNLEQAKPALPGLSHAPNNSFANKNQPPPHLPSVISFARQSINPSLLSMLEEFSESLSPTDFDPMASMLFSFLE